MKSNFQIVWIGMFPDFEMLDFRSPLYLFLNVILILLAVSNFLLSYLKKKNLHWRLEYPTSSGIKIYPSCPVANWSGIQIVAVMAAILAILLNIQI